MRNHWAACAFACALIATLPARLAAQAPAPDVLAQWGPYARLAGQSMKDVSASGYRLRWRWETEGQVLLEEWFGNADPDKPGYVMGTAEYTSPERVSGRRPEDARSDLFSLGCVLYEMLAGKTPFPGGVRQLMKEAGSDLSPNMDALPANLPDDVIGVLRRSLAAYPSDRFATARAMSAALTAAIEKLAAAA